MAIYPNATQDFIPAATRQHSIRPVMVILHTFVGPKGGGFQRPGSSLEWHFQVAVGGGVTQYMPTDIQADANWKANSFKLGEERVGAISIESGDGAHDDDPNLTKSWSDLGEIDSLIDLITWCCHTHDIPAEPCADWNQPGVGYHSMWGFNDAKPGRGTYGNYTSSTGKKLRLNNPWTTAVGKTCPGPGKIAEFDEVLATVRARLLNVGGRTTTVRPGEGWMAIARRALGDETRWMELRDFNGADPNRVLQPGDVIQLP